MQNNQPIGLINFNTEKLDYIIANNLPFSYLLYSSESSVKGFKDSIVYLAKNNYDFKNKQIILCLDLRDNYLTKHQLEELKTCDSLISLEGGSLAVNDESDELWSIDKIIYANNRIDNAVSLINSQRVPDEDNRPLNTLEKLLLAYEICRTLTYHENSDHPYNARTITSILNDGNDIVCVGYASLFQELCRRLNIPCYKHFCSVDKSNLEGQHGLHVNNIVVLNKKVFYLDVCCDSVKSGDILGKYNFFMLPYSDKKLITNNVKTRNEFDSVSSPFVNILNDKITLNLPSLLSNNQKISPLLKKQLVDIYFKYSNVIEDLIYFDNNSSDSEIKEACVHMITKLNEYDLDYTIPLEVLEKSLYNLYRSFGDSKEQSEHRAKNTLDYNISRSATIFEHGAKNSFYQEYQTKQETTI